MIEDSYDLEIKMKTTRMKIVLDNREIVWMNGCYYLFDKNDKNSPYHSNSFCKSIEWIVKENAL